jgi:hypothetical protein
MPPETSTRCAFIHLQVIAQQGRDRIADIIRQPDRPSAVCAAIC